MVSAIDFTFDKSVDPSRTNIDARQLETLNVAHAQTSTILKGGMLFHNIRLSGSFIGSTIKETNLKVIQKKTQSVSKRHHQTSISTLTVLQLKTPNNDGWF